MLLWALGFGTLKMVGVMCAACNSGGGGVWGT